VNRRASTVLRFRLRTGRVVALTLLRRRTHNRRRGEPDRNTEIPLTNFRGTELRDFPAEIARLALIIAEFQCDVLYRGQKEALAEYQCGGALAPRILGRSFRLRGVLLRLSVRCGLNILCSLGFR
jgi:hypothetical protein